VKSIAPYTAAAMMAFADATEAAGLTGDQVETLTRELHARRYTIRRWPLWATVQLVWTGRRHVWAGIRAGARSWRKGSA
jgi:hypothetical protein